MPTQPLSPAGPPRGVLLYGGSFDPIHHGHLISALCVADRLNVERVLLIPCAQSPLKRDRELSAWRHRLEMCRRAARLDARFDVCDWEAQRPGPSFTIHTVRYFRTVFPAPEPLYWLLGQDSLASLQHWMQIEELVTLVTFVTAARPGGASANFDALQKTLPSDAVAQIRAHIFDTPEIEISASEIRTRAKAGGSVQYFVPAAVAEYVAECGLYR
jgi:nicotinate-nucleotide adenylyltransferase